MGAATACQSRVVGLKRIRKKGETVACNRREKGVLAGLKVRKGLRERGEKRRANRGR